MDGDVPMRYGWQSIGLGAVGVEVMATPAFDICAKLQSEED
jgi:hypothetical protein